MSLCLSSSLPARAGPASPCPRGLTVLLTVLFRSPRPVCFPQFIGRKALLLLWLAFIAAFLATQVRSGQFSEWMAGLQLADALATAKEFAGDMLAMLRERVAAARGGGGMGGMGGGGDGAY